MANHACIFDLDGVITDTAHYHFLAWQRLAHSLGLPFDEEDNHQLKGVGRMESLDHILAKSDRAFSKEERLRLADAKNDDYKALIKGISPAELLPGVLDAFNWLKAHGWKIGLASASRNAPQVLAGLEIADIFDYVADAGTIPNGKPAPDIFLDVAKAFDIAPNQCVGVEDAVAGITAIRSAGMYAVGIGSPAVLTEAHVVLPTPERLAERVLAGFEGR